MIDADPGGLGRQLSTAVIAFHQAVADHLGISAADHKALEIVDRDGPMSARQLATATGLTPSATTALLDRLERAGLVRRSADPDDRRRLVVTATVGANPAIAGAYASLATAMAATMRGFTPKEQLVIHRYVTATIGVLQQQTARLRAQQRE